MTPQEAALEALYAVSEPDAVLVAKCAVRLSQPQETASDKPPVVWVWQNTPCGDWYMAVEKFSGHVVIPECVAKGLLERKMAEKL